MDNKISFTGIKNIASIKFNRGNQGTSRSLSMVLTDDFNGKDLSEFHNALRSITNNKLDIINKNGADILNIERVKFGEQRALFVNGKFLEANDENIPMFTYIAKLTRKIANMKNKDMIVNNDYKDVMADKVLIYDTKVSDVLPFNPEGTDFYEQYFHKDIAKHTAKQINASLQKIMEEYLCV